MLTKEHEKVAQAFGLNPEDVYTEAFADEEIPEDLLNLPPEGEEAPAEEPAMPEMEEEKEETPEDLSKDIDALKEKLQKIIDNPDTPDDVKQTAQDLLARLEELSAAVDNASEFVTSNEGLASEEAPMEEAPAEEAPAEAPAEEAPPA